VLRTKEDVLALARNPGWYAHLRRALRVDSLDELDRNQLSVVTFNYDRSLDCFLHRYVQHQFQVSADDAWAHLEQAIPIVHVHGRLAEYPNCDYADDLEGFDLKKCNTIQI